MAGQKNKLICPKCGRDGGVLTLRKAGNPKAVAKYYYIQHYEYGTKKQCYISWKLLTKVKVTDSRYFQGYNSLVTQLSHSYNGVDSFDENALEVLHQLLTMAGWPANRKTQLDKIRSDIYAHQIDRIAKSIQKMNSEELVEWDQKNALERKRLLESLRNISRVRAEIRKKLAKNT